MVEKDNSVIVLSYCDDTSNIAHSLLQLNPDPDVQGVYLQSDDVDNRPQDLRQEFAAEPSLEER